MAHQIRRVGVITRMKKLFALVLALVVTSCATQRAAESDYVSRYRAWRASLERELAAGYSKVRGDRDALSYLAAHAAEHTAFLRRELASDMFCILVLEASPLRRESSSTASSFQERQQAWLRALDQL